MCWLYFRLRRGRDEPVRHHHAIRSRHVDVLVEVGFKLDGQAERGRQVKPAEVAVLVAADPSCIEAGWIGTGSSTSPRACQRAEYSPYHI